MNLKNRDSQRARPDLSALTPRQAGYLRHRAAGVTPAEMVRLYYPTTTAGAISADLDRAVKATGASSLADLCDACRQTGT